jgi:hypothetical protein
MKRRAFITLLGNFAALHMSPIGTKRTFPVPPIHVRFRGESGHAASEITSLTARAV